MSPNICAQTALDIVSWPRVKRQWVNLKLGEDFTGWSGKGEHFMGRSGKWNCFMSTCVTHVHFSRKLQVNFGQFIRGAHQTRVSISISAQHHRGFATIDCEGCRKRNWRSEKKWRWIGDADCILKQLVSICGVLWWQRTSWSPLPWSRLRPGPRCQDQSRGFCTFRATLVCVLQLTHVNSQGIQGRSFISVYFHSHALQNAPKQTAFCAWPDLWKKCVSGVRFKWEMIKYRR